MKLVKTIEKIFEKGGLYDVDSTIGCPIEYFRKPTYKEDGYYKGLAMSEEQKNHINEDSDNDLCIKSFKIQIKIYD